MLLRLLHDVPIALRHTVALASNSTRREVCRHPLSLHVCVSHYLMRLIQSTALRISYFIRRLLLCRMRVPDSTLLRPPHLSHQPILLLYLVGHLSNIAHARLKKSSHNALARIRNKLLHQCTPRKKFVVAGTFSFGFLMEKNGVK